MPEYEIEIEKIIYTAAITNLFKLFTALTVPYFQKAKSFIFSALLID